MSTARTKFQHSSLAKVLFFSATLLALALALWLLQAERDSWIEIGSALFIAFALLLGFADFATAFLKLTPEALVFRHNFVIRKLPRSEISKVTWESGCGVSVLLENGKWMKLPSCGENSQGLTNSIRAWLKSA